MVLFILTCQLHNLCHSYGFTNIRKLHHVSKSVTYLNLYNLKKLELTFMFFDTLIAEVPSF